MEYRILDVSERCTLEDATKSLKRIRVKYHPDKLMNLPQLEKDKNKHFLNLAEEAFECIRKRLEVDTMMSKFDIWPERFDNVFRNIDAHVDRMAQYMSHNSNSVHTSTYTYQNMDGVEKDSGYINNRPMTDSELQKYRPFKN